MLFTLISTYLMELDVIKWHVDSYHDHIITQIQVPLIPPVVCFIPNPAVKTVCYGGVLPTPHLNGLSNVTYGP